MPEALCESLQGVYGGNGTACDAKDACVPVATGACCLPSGRCVVTTGARCDREGGRYAGDGTLCAAVVCAPAPVGACCLPSGRCEVTTARRCEEAGGRFAGVNTTCGEVECRRPACPCDWNRDGVLDNDDLADFVHDYMAGAADFNGDGATDREDLRAFVECFTRGCG